MSSCLRALLDYFSENLFIKEKKSNVFQIPTFLFGEMLGVVFVGRGWVKEGCDVAAAPAYRPITRSRFNCCIYLGVVVNRAWHLDLLPLEASPRTNGGFFFTSSNSFRTFGITHAFRDVSAISSP